MSYTIYLAENETETESLDPDLCLNYQVHQAIFTDDEIPLHDLTHFYNLSDFYQNATFVGDHVLGLRVDLEEARRRIQTPRATEPLSALCKLCDRALKNGLNLYAFGE